MVAGALLGGLAVIFGAFGAHAIRGSIEVHRFSAFETGIQYQMYHALALLIVGVLLTLHPEQTALKWSGLFFIVGTLLFSGSLYLLATTQAGFLGPITPVGGFGFILGWGFFLYAVANEFQHS